MINPKKIEEIAKQITENMPQGVKNIAETVESKTKQVLQSKLSQMDFVSREEFEIQTQVLIRTREKLTTLEENYLSLKLS
jgi:hypothetical protein